MQVDFEVRGSAASPYRATFDHRETGNLAAFCTCPAGQNGQYCKHRFLIMAGSSVGIVSGNEHEVALVVSWLKGSDVERKLHELREAEERLDVAKRAVSRAKQELARSLRE